MSMSFWYIVFGLLVLCITGAITWKYEKNQGDDQEPDFLAVAKNVVIAFLILIAFWNIMQTIAKNLMEYWWYQEVGQAQVWVTQMSYGWGLRIIGFVITFVTLSITNAIAHLALGKTDKTPQKSSHYPNDDQSQLFAVYNRYSRWINLTVRIIVSLVFAWGATWLLNETLKLFHIVEWGRNVPFMNVDYSFYDVVFPWLSGLSSWLLLLIVANIIFAAALYGSLLDKIARFQTIYGNTDSRQGHLVEGAITHAAIIVALLFLLFAMNAYLDRYALLIDGNTSVIEGAGYIDIAVRLPGMIWMMWAWIIAAIIAVVYAFIDKMRWQVPAVGASIVLLVWVGTAVLAPWFRSYEYNTNPLGFETPYIMQQIKGTKFAYDLERIKNLGSISYTATMTKEQLQNNEETLNQTRVVDWEPMLAANDTLNEYIQVYDFNDVDIDRYNGVEVMLGMREINSEQIPEAAKNWTNIHFRYTHGYGYTIASVSEIDQHGEPRWLVQKIPPSGPEEFLVENPEIYFGELTTEYIFVNANIDEFGRPEGETLREVRYNGPAGIKLGGFAQRLVLALVQDDIRPLTSSLLRSDSRVIFNRTLNQRLNKLGNFLICDEDPYGVVGGSEIVYIRDCYTVSGNMPYSVKTGESRYMRASVKMTVGAWSGDTDFYIVDDKDPVIKTWSSIYPTLFKSVSAMPQHLQMHLRYPDDLIRTQADVYGLYHMDVSEKGASTFYNRQDQWERSKETIAVSGDATPADPRYVMMTIPGNDEPEFVSSVYFTPLNKQNMIAGMYARSDPGVYGQLLINLFPRDESVLGMQTFESRILTHPELKTRIGQLNQPGSTVRFGQTIGLILTTEEGISVIYIRAIYLESKEAKIPSIKYVVVGHGDQMIYSETLAGALNKLYNGGESTNTDSTVPLPAPVGSQAELIQQANQHFRAAEECAAAGNWTCFGTEMDALRNVLEALNSRPE